MMRAPYFGTLNSGLGRRAEALADVARMVVVKATVGQCRKTRRNNLRIARIDARPPAVAARKEAARRWERRCSVEANGRRFDAAQRSGARYRMYVRLCVFVSAVLAKLRQRIVVARVTYWPNGNDIMREPWQRTWARMLADKAGE